jgi:L-amino acid N-acyltransferase YncA
MIVEVRTVADSWAELAPLIEAHALEVYGISAKPDKARYIEMDEANDLALVCMTDAGNIVGYATVVCNRHLHTAQNIAILDAIYLDKRFRVGRNGLILIEAVERIARASGAKSLIANAKPGSALGKILARRYAVDEISYSRSL